MGKKIVDPERPSLILCEGADAYYFLISFLDNIKKSDNVFNKFNVYDFGGIDQLPLALKSVTLDENFKTHIHSISIIRDAEKNALGAIQSIKNALRSNGFTVPDGPCLPQSSLENIPYSKIAVGYLLFPTCSYECKNGTLEDLCLNILAKSDANSILRGVKKALKPFLKKRKLPRSHKNKLHTYFSFTDDFVSLKIGEAAKANAFSWRSPQMTSLKNFLQFMA